MVEIIRTIESAGEVGVCLCGLFGVCVGAEVDECAGRSSSQDYQQGDHSEVSLQRPAPPCGCHADTIAPGSRRNALAPHWYGLQARHRKVALLRQGPTALKTEGLDPQGRRVILSYSLAPRVP